MSVIRGEWLDGVVRSAEHATWNFATAASLIALCIPCDEAFYVELDFGRPSAIVVGFLHDCGAINADVLLTERGMDPLTASYLTDPSDRTPRRISDVTTQGVWEATEAYSEVFRPLHARYQLSMVTALHAPMIERGWTLTRSLHDFSERDRATAAALLPLVAVMTNRIQREGREGVPLPLLTRQERTVLALVARGWTASHIGFELSISDRTVQKHLENAYRKLGVADRLSATQRAIELRLI